MLRNAVFAVLASLALPALASRPEEAAPWQPPAATSTAEQERIVVQKGISPKVTVSPVPPFGIMDDLRRDLVGTNTCGYFTNDATRPLTCSPGETCTNSGNYRDCCVGAGCSTSSFSTVCLDATAAACSGTTLLPSGTFCCNNDAQYPYCVTYLWATSTDPSNVYTLYNCDVAAFSGQEILLPTPSASTTSSSSPTSTFSSTSSSTSASTTTSAPSSSSSAPIGAIVGGVVGGLAVIGVVAVIIVALMMRKRRRAAAEAPPNVVPQPQPQEPQGPPMGDMSHMSYQGSYFPSQRGSVMGGVQDPRYGYGVPSPGSPTTPSVGVAPSMNPGTPAHLVPGSHGYGVSPTGFPPSDTPQHPTPKPVHEEPAELA